jgi:hypothetical protein
MIPCHFELLTDALVRNAHVSVHQLYYVYVVRLVRNLAAKRKRATSPMSKPHVLPPRALLFIHNHFYEASKHSSRFTSHDWCLIVYNFEEHSSLWVCMNTTNWHHHHYCSAFCHSLSFTLFWCLVRLTTKLSQSIKKHHYNLFSTYYALSISSYQNHEHTTTSVTVLGGHY